jgi:hypothetical protein
LDRVLVLFLVRAIEALKAGNRRELQRQFRAEARRTRRGALADRQDSVTSGARKSQLKLV